MEGCWNNYRSHELSCTALSDNEGELRGAVRSFKDLRYKQGNRKNLIHKHYYSNLPILQLVIVFHAAARTTPFTTARHLSVKSHIVFDTAICEEEIIPSSQEKKPLFSDERICFSVRNFVYLTPFKRSKVSRYWLKKSKQFKSFIITENIH